MPTTTLPTLSDLQKTPVAKLRAIALTSRNRQFAIACDMMASASESYSVGDIDGMKACVERAKTAWKRANEDEGGQIMRVRATAAAIEGSVKL